MKRYDCEHCRLEVFFDSMVCERCHWNLIFDPGAERFRSTSPESDLNASACANRQTIQCNWARGDEPGGLCRSCVLTTKVPDLAIDGHRVLWGRLEAAKRCVVNALDKLDLRHPPKGRAPRKGLEFHFLADDPNASGPGAHVLTGHDRGTIVINIAEADDATREQRRNELKEPYRTLVGHIRHELGHYYWDRLIGETAALPAYRELFGDERLDYNTALKTYYDGGPAPDWRDRFVSAYSSCHPWEDFAETWAHYLHAMEGLETANAFELTRIPADMRALANDSFPYLTSVPFERMFTIWTDVTIAVNAMNRSMGQPDLYPFVLSGNAIEKVAFVHELILANASETRAAA